MAIEPFIFVQTAPLKEGRLAGYRDDFRDTAKLVAEHEPRLLHFASYVNDEGTEQTVIQVHPDPDSMRTHMEIAARHIRERGARNLDSAGMHIEVYGTPTRPVLELMQELAGSGVPITVKTMAAGFTRLEEIG